MPNFVHILLRTLAGISGALLLYVAFFLYEDEEARIQNRLEHIWQQINALQTGATSREAAFLKAATGATSAFLNRIFGESLISNRALTVACAFSLASLVLGRAYFQIDPISRRLPVTVCALALLILVVVPPFWEPKYTPGKFPIIPELNTALLQLAILGATLLVARIASKGDFEHTAYQLRVASVAGIACDVLFIIFFRWVLKRAATVNKVRSIVGYLFAVLMTAILLVGPAILMIRNPSAFPAFLNRDNRLFEMPTSHFLANLGLSNLVDAACLLILAMVFVLLLLHRLLWPMMKRPIYAANRKQLIKNTKLLGALGTMLLLYAFPNNPVVNWITHFLPNLKGG